jgi:hypothetical protein
MGKCPTLARIQLGNASWRATDVPMSGEERLDNINVNIKAWSPSNVEPNRQARQVQ